MLEKRGKRFQKNSNNDPSSYAIKTNYYTKNPKILKENLHIYFYFIVVA
jgi:hypothetical protein